MSSWFTRRRRIWLRFHTTFRLNSRREKMESRTSKVKKTLLKIVISWPGLVSLFFSPSFVTSTRSSTTSSTSWRRKKNSSSTSTCTNKWSSASTRSRIPTCSNLCNRMVAPSTICNWHTSRKKISIWDIFSISWRAKSINSIRQRLDTQASYNWSATII